MGEIVRVIYPILITVESLVGLLVLYTSQQYPLSLIRESLVSSSPSEKVPSLPSPFLRPTPSKIESRSFSGTLVLLDYYLPDARLRLPRGPDSEQEGLLLNVYL